MSWLLVGAGLVAGAMNAIAGGGSFVTLPALVWAGVPAVTANASSTVALFPGGLASVFGYRGDFRPVGRVGLGWLMGVTLAGGMCGAVLLLVTPGGVFDAVIPWLLLLATVAFAFGGRIGERLRRRVRIGAGAVLGAQFGLGVYGGYFGGAVGIMMMAMWGLLDGTGAKAMAPARTLMVTAANAVAVAVFSVVGAVRWAETLAVLAGAVVGGYAGARIGRRMPAGMVRGLVIVITVMMTIGFFVRAYAPGAWVFRLRSVLL